MYEYSMPCFYAAKPMRRTPHIIRAFLWAVTGTSVSLLCTAWVKFNKICGKSSPPKSKTISLHGFVQRDRFFMICVKKMRFCGGH